jgi:hypothetical protein
LGVEGRKRGRSSYGTKRNVMGGGGAPKVVAGSASAPQTAAPAAPAK